MTKNFEMTTFRTRAAMAAAIGVLGGVAGALAAGARVRDDQDLSKNNSNSRLVAFLWGFCLAALLAFAVLYFMAGSKSPSPTQNRTAGLASSLAHAVGPSLDSVLRNVHGGDPGF